jgi:hypothetical protein
MQKIFEFFGGKAVIVPHYVHTDHPQIGTLPEFIDLVLDCWTPEKPAIIYVSAKPDGGYQPEVFEVFNRRGFSIKHPSRILKGRDERISHDSSIDLLER